MPSALSLFSCCSRGSNSGSKRLPQEADDGAEPKPRVRAAGQLHHNVARLPRHSVGRVTIPTETSYPQAPPSYSDIAHDDQVALLAWVDEKTPQVQEIVPEEDDNDETRPIMGSHGSRERRPSPAPTVTSEVSTTISIPSTRLSGLTSSYTGATFRSRLSRDGRTGESERHSATFGSRCSSVMEASPPPSYYAESDSGGDDEAVLQRHPVMADGWLERLQLDAGRYRGRENGEGLG